MWQIESESFGDCMEYLEVGTLAGALALRGDGLVLDAGEGKDGGTER